jgi:hypothetical protein
MNWNPNQAQPTQAFPFQPQPAVVQQQGFGPPQGVPQYGAPPGPGPAPQAPVQGFGQPQGFGQQPAPMGQPQGFGVPQAPQGFAQPQPFNQPVAFNAQDPSLDDREDAAPLGTCSFECTGEVELGGQARNLLIVKCKTLTSNNPQVAPGTPFAFKRSLVPHARWGVKYASDDIGKFIAAILAFDSKTTPASQITPLINELVRRGTVGGQSIAGRRGVVTGVQSAGKPSAEFPQGKPFVKATWAKHP